MQNLMRALAFVLVAALVGPACAEAPQREAPALFVARDDNSTLYLFGTMHIRRPGGSWGGADAEAALAEAEEVWTEVEMGPDADARGAALMLEHGRAPPDRPLSSWLSEAENAQLQAALRRLDAPPHALETMQPWLAALMLSVMPMMQAGYDPNAGVDRAIDAAAEAQGKRLRAFETVEDQIGFLSGFSEEVQRQMLLDAIVEAEKGQAEFEAMAAAWERGDLATLEGYVIDDMREEYPELYDVLFVRRNAAWMEILQRELEGAGVDFVAVGAGHLLGADGLVAQLQRRGYDVQRVSGERRH